MARVSMHLFPLKACCKRREVNVLKAVASLPIPYDQASCRESLHCLFWARRILQFTLGIMYTLATFPRTGVFGASCNSSFHCKLFKYIPLKSVFLLKAFFSFQFVHLAVLQIRLIKRRPIVQNIPKPNPLEVLGPCMPLNPPPVFSSSVSLTVQVSLALLQTTNRAVD